MAILRNKLFSWYQRNTILIWVSIKFVLYLGIFFLLLTSSFGQSQVVHPFTRGVAYLSAAILRILGMPVISKGTSIIGSSFQMRVAAGCEGIPVIVLIVVGMLATPASWMYRTIGIALAGTLLYIINLSRAVSLFVIAVWRPQWFDFAHVYLWQTVVVLATLAIFMVWLGWVIPMRWKTDC